MPVFDHSEALNQTINILLQALLPVLVTVIASVFSVILLKVNTFIQSKVSAEKLAQFGAVVNLLVTAAEQSGLKDSLLKDGAAKKAWVLKEAQRILNERGFKQIDVALLSSLVEKAIYDLNTKQPAIIEALPLRYGVVAPDESCENPDNCYPGNCATCT